MIGGLGSGRPGGSASDTVAACGSIDVNRLCPQGCLRASSECERCSQVIYWPPLIPAGESKDGIGPLIINSKKST